MRRRDVLKLLGSSLTLPFLPSLLGANERAGARPPRRLAWVVYANGFYESDWIQSGSGAGMQLGPQLHALAPYTQDLLFVNGMRLLDRVSGVHAPFFTNLLSGTDVHPSELPKVGRSIDRELAAELGGQTLLPSLHLGTEPFQQGIREKVPGLYWDTITWDAVDRPIPPEIFPRQVFDTLFAGNPAVQAAQAEAEAADEDSAPDQGGVLKPRDRSVLDALLEQSRSLKPKLDAADTRVLDEYMDSIRSLEHRMDHASREERREGWTPNTRGLQLQRPPEALPQDLREHHRLMLDLMVLALRMDRTRIATLLLESDGSKVKMDWLDGVTVRNQYHSISHHHQSAEHLASYRRINRYHMDLLGELLQRMRAIDEGHGTLLDNTMLVYTSSMMDGDKHNWRKLPLIVAGGRNCGIASGRVLAVPEGQHRLCNLHLALAQRLGSKLQRWGNSDGVLDLG